MIKGTIHAIGKGKCSPPHANKNATVNEHKKPQSDKMFGVNLDLINSLTGRSTNLFKSLR
jgi:hypothetical protein